MRLSTLAAILLCASPAGAQEKPFYTDWVTLKDGIACRVKAEKTSIDVDEHLAHEGTWHRYLFLEIKNVDTERLNVQGNFNTIKFFVFKDGKPVQPLYDFGAYNSEPLTQDGASSLGNWEGIFVDPGKSTYFDMSYWGMDANFGNPNRQYFLAPGKYQIKVVYRTFVYHYGKENPPARLIELPPFDLTVTGNKDPLPTWVSLQSRAIPQMPEGAKKLSAKLLELPARDALKLYLKEYTRFHQSIPTLILETPAAPGRPAERLVRVKGQGHIHELDPKSEVMEWADYKEKFAARIGWFDGVEWNPHSLESRYTGQTVFGRAFGIPPQPAAFDRYWFAYRAGDCLVYSDGYWFSHYFWIDLRTLAVVAQRSRYEVTRYEDHRFVDGYDFPVSGQCVIETYDKRRAVEPARAARIPVRVALADKAPERFRLPKPLGLDHPGTFRWNDPERKLPTLDLEIKKNANGQLIGELRENGQIVKGKAGEVRATPLGRLAYGDRGWWLEKAEKK